MLGTFRLLASMIVTHLCYFHLIPVTLDLDLYLDELPFGVHTLEFTMCLSPHITMSAMIHRTSNIWE